MAFDFFDSRGDSIIRQWTGWRTKGEDKGEVKKKEHSRRKGKDCQPHKANDSQIEGRQAVCSALLNYDHAWRMPSTPSTAGQA